MQKQEPKFNLIVTASPHIGVDDHIVRRMWATFFSLIPAGIVGIYTFGIRALYVTLVAILTALIAEAVVQKFRHKEPSLLDGSAIITGLLLAYNLPPNVPLWLVVLGSFFAIVIAKHLFGGLGANIFNPALAARAFLLVSWPKYMTTWQSPRWQIDAISSATPLMLFKEKGLHKITEIGVTYKDLFLGNRLGCIGEVCIVALLIGAAYLLLKGYITWHVPITYIFTFGIFSWIFLGKGLFNGDVIFQILSGGLILGAFFMATDYVTAPITKKGKVIFGVGCGILTFVIRKWGGYPEGVSYSILMMNAATPIIDRFARPKKYGFIKKIKND
ncbi:MAG: RnfABCDGE type electron transport complex subunit D [Candidatus Omnitrophota bacterium]